MMLDRFTPEQQPSRLFELDRSNSCIVELPAVTQSTTAHPR